MHSLMTGVGQYLPKKVVTNYDLAAMVETSHDWIVQRTGIHQRHIGDDDETTSFMGIKAAQEALANTGLIPDDIDFIVCATTTPDMTMPATAVKIQAGLNMHRGFAFDVQAACGGFVYALAIADNFIRTQTARRGLVIGAEKMSCLLDWTDRSTCVLFGDGAGAVVLEANSDPSCGILGTHLRSDGHLADILCASGGAATSENVGKIIMDGRSVYKHAVVKLAEAMADILTQHSIPATDVDWLIPHQANERIIDAIAERLNFPKEKIVKTVGQHANTSAASIPLALAHAVKHKMVKKGDLILMDALGAGLAWGSALVRW